ncbi:MAG: MFS transporter [Acidimicrobiia bacterium]|nr:MFS transporter [Acidimicrobiia bacterium]
MDAATSSGGAFEPLRIAHFPKVYASGWIWAIGRWGMGFLGAYAVNDLTGSPRLVQLTGSMMWGPLLVAGLVGGTISDRFDRRRLVLVQLAALTPLVVAIGLLALADRLEVWMIYPFMLAVGIGWIIDMTVRRALIFDLVGDAHINGAMALEMLSSASGLAIGAAVGGTMVEVLGIGWAYLLVAAGLAIAFGLMWRVPSPPKAATADPVPFRRAVADGFRVLPSHPALVSILGVTVVVDLFHFSYFPLITVVAANLDASAWQTGALAASSGAGMMLGSLWVAARRPHRGRAYVGGSGLACLLLVAVALSGHWLVALALLVGAGFSMGLFGATQAALAITATSPDMRGRAMGLLSMAIGALPVGMYALGELAEAVGANEALVAFNVFGLAALVAWVLKRREVWHTE